MDIVTLIPALAPYGGAITAVIAVAAAVATQLPRPATGATGAYPVIYAVVNFVAFNLNHAANK